MLSFQLRLVFTLGLAEMISMSIFSLRNILTVVAGISASAVAVRNALGKEVDKRAEKLIEAAVEEARQEIRTEAHAAFSGGFRQFVITTVVKACLVGIVAAFFLSDLLPPEWSALALILMFVMFFSYDMVKAFPTLKFLRRELKKHGWRPRLILSETVSAQVFERVLERASGEPVDRTESVLMLLAGRKRDEVVERVARAVAEIASTSSWNDIRPIVLRFALRFSIMFVLYSALVWAVVWLIRQNVVG